MKNRQYALKVFETTIDDEERFISFFDTNAALFQDHLIVIKGPMSQRIEAYLDEKSLIYLHDVTLPRGRTKKPLEEEVKLAQLKHIISKNKAEAEVKKLSSQLENNLRVMDTIVRSGRELKIEGDLLLLNRVNSGATINITGNLIITNIVEGAIRCKGNFMMITASPKANIVFHDCVVDNELLKDKLNRIEFDKESNEIIITPVLKKEINWA